MIETGTVVTVITSAGDEIIGKLAAVDGTSVVVEKPRLLMKNPDGSDAVGFGSRVCLTAEDNTDTISIGFYSLLVKTSKEISDTWEQVVNS